MKLFLPYYSCYYSILQSIRGYGPYLSIFLFICNTITARLVRTQFNVIFIYIYRNIQIYLTRNACNYNLLSIVTTQFQLTSLLFNSISPISVMYIAIILKCQFKFVHSYYFDISTHIAISLNILSIKSLFYYSIYINRQHSHHYSDI